MEDAAIHEVDLGDGVSLFGVFDGHGGTHHSTQATRLASTSKENSFISSPTSIATKRKTSKLPSMKPSS